MNNKTTTVEIADIANEYLERMRAGESPSLVEYETRYPEHAEEIRNVFPMMLLMEENAAPDESLEETTLKQLGDFRIIREIGRGGMGVVYEANQESLGRQVALKVFPERMQVSARNRERFRRESRAAAMLHHSNIVSVFAVGEEDGHLYYAMQYIAGASLDEVIVELRHLESEQPKEWTQLTNVQFRGNTGASQSVTREFGGNEETVEGDNSIAYARSESNVASLPGQSQSDSDAGATARYWSSVARVGVQVADALNYAHDHGTLHRDIKPGNLMLDEAGTVWVLDFGLAKSTLDDGLTNDGEMIGTLRYMSPEQCKGNADQRSDIYGVGMTLYEMLTLRPAYGDESRHELLRSIMENEPTRPRKINPRVPRDLETIVLKSIERDPSRRYQTAQQLQDDLQRFLNGEPIDARRVGTVERVRKWVRRRPVVASLLAALATMFIVSFALITWNWRDAVAARSLAEERETKATTAAKSERKARVIAASNLERAEDLLYSSEISRVQATATTNPTAARLALDSLVPNEDQKDRRDWEWGYLDTLINQEIACFECGAPQAEFIWDLAFSHDDSMLAVCAGRTRFMLPNDGSSPRGRVTVWNTRSNKLVCELPIERSGYAASFSHDNRLLVVSEPFTPSLWETEFHGPVQVWDITTKKPVVSLKIPDLHRANMLHFSNDDKLVFGTIWPKSGQFYANPTAFVVWNAKTGDEVKRVGKAEFVEATNESNVVILKKFQSDGAQIVRYDLDADKVLSSWPQQPNAMDVVSTKLKLGVHLKSSGLVLTDLESGRSDNIVGQDGYRPQARMQTRGVLGFHPSMPEMYVGASDGTVRIWSTDTQEIGKTLRGHVAPVNAIAVSHHGHMLASGDWNGQVRTWQPEFSSHLRKLHPRSERTLRGRLEAVGFRWNGAGVVAFENGRLQTFETESGRLLDERFLKGRALSGYRTAAFDDQGRWMGLIGAPGKHSIEVYDVESGEIVCETQGKFKDAHSVCFAKDKPRFACVTGMSRAEPSKAHVFEIEKGMMASVEVLTYDAEDISLDSISLDDSGERIAIAGRTLDDESDTAALKIIVVDIATGKKYALPDLKQLVKGQRRGVVPSIAFSPDGKRLAACTRDGLFAIYDLESNTLIAKDSHAPEALEDVCWNPTGTRVAGVNRETMVLWNAQGRVVLQTPREHRVSDLPFDPEVRFSPDGQRIAANMWDHSVKVWTSRSCLNDDAKPESRRSSTLAVESIKSAVSAHDNPWYLATRGYLQSVDGNQAEAAADYLEAKKRLAGDDPAILFAGPAYVTGPSVPFHDLEEFTVEYWVKNWNSYAGIAPDSVFVGQIVSQFPAPDKFGVTPNSFRVPAFFDNLTKNVKFDDKWIHVMFVQNKTFRRQFINGKRARNGAPYHYDPNTERFHVADTIFHDVNSKGRGLMRSVHVSRGVLQTENFTPAETIEANENTIFLYDFTKDDVLNSSVIKDRSGNGNDGVLHRAWWQR